MARLSGQSSCPRGVNLFGMWRVQRLDQINAFKPANLFDFKSLTLKFRREQIDRFKIVIRTEANARAFVGVISQSPASCPRQPNANSCGLRLSRRVISAIHFLADDCEARGGCVDRIGFPRKSDGRHAYSRLKMAFGTGADEPKLLRRALVLDRLPCGFPNHFERHSRRCGD